jgi:hypothetical protein
MDDGRRDAGDGRGAGGLMLYPSPIEEAGALRRAAMRAGCCVLELQGGDGRVRGVVECADGWGAARLLVALGAEDRSSPWARELARELRAAAPDDASFAEAVLAFVKERLRFVREAPGAELFQSGPYSLLHGEGDCEDHARLVYALAVAGGLPARFAFLHRGDGPTHAVAQVRIGDVPTWAETTIDARLGEHPLEAGRRLGLLHSRSDITQGVRVMTEQSLKPIPKGFLVANDATQVQRDAQALAVLGYLTTDVAMAITDPTDQRFRAAVLAFQRKTNITIDGLIGPQTRRTIAGALPQNEFGQGYVAATTAAPVNARMRWAWPIMTEAARAFGIESSDAVAILLAIGWLETQYGNPALRWEDSNNWGGVHFVDSEPFRSWGPFEHGDKDASGRPVTYRFQRYPSPLEGAKGAVRAKVQWGGKRGKIGGDAVRRALLAGDADGVAREMYLNGYYTGTTGTADDRIAAYAAAIHAHLPAVRASAPTGTTFDGGRGGIGSGAIVAGVALVIAVGAAYLVNR